MADLVTQAALLADVDAKVTTNGANENTGARVNANLHNIVDTLWNHAGIAGVGVGTCLFVNATTGDDGTGVRGRMDKMYETLDAAYADSVAGDVIVIFDAGTYYFNNDVTKDLNLYAPLAIINPQGGSSSSLLLAVNDLNVTIECGVFNGPIAQGSGITGCTVTLQVGSVTDTIEADNVTMIGGFAGGNITAVALYMRNVVMYYTCEAQSSEIYNCFLGPLRISGDGYAFTYNTAITSIVAVTGYAEWEPQGGFLSTPVNRAEVFTASSPTSAVGVAPTLAYGFDSNTTAADPGSGKFRCDNAASTSSVTKIYLSVLDHNGSDTGFFLDDLTAGQLVLRRLDNSKAILFDVSAVSGSGTWRTLDVSFVLGDQISTTEFYTFDFREAGGGSSTPQTLADTLIEGQETSGRSIIISEFDGINFEQGVNQVRLKAPATATGSRAQTLQDKDGEIALTSDIPLIDSIGGLVETAANTTYRLGGPSAFAYTIDSLDVETASGTITVAVKVNGTAVTGLSAVAASSTPASATATAANTVAVGDYLTFVTSSNSGATGLLFGITITRTP